MLTFDPSTGGFTPSSLDEFGKNILRNWKINDSSDNKKHGILVIPDKYKIKPCIK